MKTQKLKILFNVFGFKTAWLACVLGAVAGFAWFGPLIMGFFIIVNTKLLEIGRKELQFIFLAAVIGTVVDSLKASTGFITYTAGYPEISWIAPLWITAMWIGFAATMNHGLGWMKNNMLLAFVMGAVFGPLAYIGGSKLGGITLNYSLPVTITVLSVVWGTVLPSFYKLSGKLQEVKI